MFWTSAHVFNWPDQERKCPQGTSESGTWWLKDRWGRERENWGEEGGALYLVYRYRAQGMELLVDVGNEHIYLCNIILNNLKYLCKPGVKVIQV